MAQAPFRPIQRSQQRVQQRPLVIRTGSNRFEFDRDMIPGGMCYEWKRKTMFGAEDVENLINLDQNGWVPVPADRHPELMGRRATVGGEIVRGGLILMERPEEISEEARELDTFAARSQVAQQIQRLGLEGKRAAGKGIKTSYDHPDAPNVVPD
jgi:hypothetical protein